MNLTLILTSIGAAALGQILMRASQTGVALLTVYGIRVSGTLMAGLACHVIAAVLWLLVLSRYPVSRAYPFTVLTHALVPILAWSLLGEPLSLRNLFALGLSVGVVLIAR